MNPWIELVATLKFPEVKSRFISPALVVASARLLPISSIEAISVGTGNDHPCVHWTEPLLSLVPCKIPEEVCNPLDWNERLVVAAQTWVEFPAISVTKPLTNPGRIYSGLIPF